MATVPLSGTHIRLLSGVPFSNDCKNTRWFDSQTAQVEYFTNKRVVHTMSEANFQRIEGYHYIAVNLNIDDLWGANYMMFRNPKNGSWWYAFVTKLEYKNKGLTWVHFQIDVFQTWWHYSDFKPSYVVREHCKQWNADGTPVINTVDEGLHYGNHYEVVDVENYKPYNDVFFLVIVSKSLIHDRADANANDIYPTVNGLPQPLCYYVHPFKLDNTVPLAMQGGEAFILDSATQVLNAIYKLESAVNNIVSLYVTDYIGVDIPIIDGDVLDMPAVFANVNILQSSENNTYLHTAFFTGSKRYLSKTKNFGSKYNGFRPVKESKLLMYPYALTILDDLKGNRQTFKNEYIETKDLTITTRGSVGTSNKVSYTIDNYLIKDDLGVADWFPANVENSLINNNPNDLPIITDMLSAYMQGNRNTIENQKNSIVFNGVVNSIGGIVSGVASAPNPAGIAAAGVNVVSGAGNAVLQIQGLQAKQQDINNVPPSLVKMGGNTYFDYGNGLVGLYIIKKQITPEYQTKLENFFNMFGYKLNEVKIPNFHTRRYWNYVQTNNCMITGDFNHDDLNELKAIFDNGITFWHTDDVGNYSLVNEVIS